MDIKPDIEPSHRLGAAVCAALLAAGLAWGIHSLWQSRGRLAGLTPSAWLDGSAGQALKPALRLPAQAQVETGLAALRYRLLGSLGKQVVQGCPGWLFYRDGLQPQPGHAQAFAQRLRLMRHWVGELRATGVQVLVVAVPDKSRVEAARLCGLQAAPAMRERLDDWHAGLAASQVPYVDLRAALDARTPGYFRTDVHMNGHGAAASAEAVAAAALHFLGQPGQQRYAVGSAARPTERVGDLLVLAGLEHAPDRWRPLPDLVREQTVKPEIAGGLLDEVAPPEVLLAGSSNGRRSHFAERLGMRLGRQVWNLSMDGGQFSGALQAALRQRAQWPASLRLVIWEFSEMALSLPLTEDEKTTLATLPSR
ncbi:cell division protein FtsQ [Cupriavidus basilensis]|uniref:Cell division protein FtsQ n=1 Tax=Cupriavidus basilensis TaxID=68895 RepID=A0ABT6AMD6_9BURK|nr:cell division protein FtsQ [Cupriavidus basilensis]MDF3833748.1 cell division protein FtsQ [Cupriavidus basilensis]